MNNKIKIVIIIVLLVIFLLPMFNAFMIIDVENNNIVYVSAASKITEFYIQFIHSVNKTPVYEYYKISNQQFYLCKTEFYSYGAGMPEFEDYGQRPYIEDGIVHVDNLNIKMESFTIFVGTIANHTINFNNTSLKLSQIVKPGKSAQFKVGKVSLFTLLRGN